MTPFEVIVLALIQGATEFLPVSSSGHLVLANTIMGVREPGIAMEIVLHFGTLFAVLIYFRRDLIDLARGLTRFIGGAKDSAARASGMMTLAIAVATVPAAAAGLLLGDSIEALFENPKSSAAALIVTGVVLLSTLLCRKSDRQVSTGRALGVGLAQAVALVPGISRSGSTIAAGMALGVRPDEAARFSFLLLIPAILGAGILKLPELKAEVGAGLGPLLVLGFLVALAVGYAAIAFLLSIVRRGRFAFFGIYCIVVGIAALIWLGSRGF